MGSSDGVIRVLITDDHPVMRDGLRAAIAQEADMEVVGEAADGAEAIERYRALQPDVTLIDLQMPNVDGLEAIQAIRADYPQAVMVVLTTFPGDARVTRAMKRRDFLSAEIRLPRRDPACGAGGRGRAPRGGRRSGAEHCQSPGFGIADAA